jgi:hypothetical protein
MGAAPGIAGSRVPEQEGVFLCRDESEVSWFVRMNNSGGPVDVWAVTGVEEDQLLDNGSGLSYFPARILGGQVTLADSADTGSTRPEHPVGCGTPGRAGCPGGRATQPMGRPFTVSVTSMLPRVALEYGHT